MPNSPSSSSPAQTLLAILSCLFLSTLSSAQQPAPERLEVLFLGDDRGHNPIERFRVLKQALAPKGYNLTFQEDLSLLTRERLDLHDALIVYANHESDQLPTTIIPWVRDGGGLVALHSACGCFHPSPEWFALIGGRFQSHEGHVFSPRNVDENHPITKDLPTLKAWDETYVHQGLTNDRNVLQERDPLNQGEESPEPWTWTRTEGLGRVFYTASGHDMRVWNELAYQTLVERGILWAIGDDKAASFESLELPPLEVEIPELANRAHPDIPMMPLQKPLSPTDSERHTQVPAGTRLELFASEPMVVNPIAIDWDHLGRAWVVESFGYPNDVPDEKGAGEDRIKILEDTDGDGRADKMTVFADKLRHGTTTTFYRGGVIATDGKEVVYLRDEDGDDKADSRQVLASGLRIWDTHASTSHFLYGLDNWIYATVGYSGVDMTVADQKHQFGPAVFRFQPDFSQLEFLQRTTNNTWGLGFTADGEILGSTANNNPSWMMSTPAESFARSGIEQPKTPRLDNQPFFYPNTFDITQVDQINRFTAAAGHMLYHDSYFPNIIAANSALICAPTGHLVAMGKITERDSLLKIDLRGQNLFASSDAWSSPVAARPGPDGAVWIADWYNPIIQHNVVFRYWNPARGYDQPHSPYHVGKRKPGKGNAYVTPLRDRKHGRIWRIVPAQDSLREEFALDPEDPASLVLALNSPSQHLRLTAQRLLVESGTSEQTDALTQLIVEQASPTKDGEPVGAYHAIWTLHGLDSGSDALAQALSSSHSGIRLQAALAHDANSPALVAALPTLLLKTGKAAELRRLLAKVALAPSNKPLADALWIRAISLDSDDESLRQVTALAMRQQGIALLDSALQDDIIADKWLREEIEAIAQQVAQGPNREALLAILKTAPNPVRQPFTEILKSAPSKPTPKAELPEHLIAGRDAYLKSCVECHQADGKGVEATFPPLAGSEWVTSEASTLLRIILGGLMGPVTVAGVEYNSAMPGHAYATDDDLAAIASYVRHTFGSLQEDPVSPEQVKALRPEVEARQFTPWTALELKEAQE